jgi:hypothetical protein
VFQPFFAAQNARRSEHGSRAHHGCYLLQRDKIIEVQIELSIYK